METTTTENVADAAMNLAHLTRQVAKARILIDDVIDDGRMKAQRTLKRGKFAAEDCIEDTTHFIKRHPWQSVGGALGLGAGIGLLLGWVTSRACARNGSA